jgi:hypothetical protein
MREPGQDTLHCKGAHPVVSFEVQTVSDFRSRLASGERSVPLGMESSLHPELGSKHAHVSLNRKSRSTAKQAEVLESFV